MDIRPHPERKRRAIVTVNDYNERFAIVMHPFLNLRPSHFRVIFEGANIITPKPFPHELTVSYRNLGRIAGSLLEFADEPHHTDDLDTARQITKFFAGQAVAHVRSETAADN